MYVFQVKVIVHVDRANYVASLGTSSHFDEVQTFAIWHIQLSHLHHDMTKSNFQTNMVDGLSFIVIDDIDYLLCEGCVIASNIVKKFLPILCTRRHLF
jgi:hypothetical protein